MTREQELESYRSAFKVAAALTLGIVAAVFVLA